MKGSRESEPVQDSVGGESLILASESKEPDSFVELTASEQDLRRTSSGEEVEPGQISLKNEEPPDVEVKLSILNPVSRQSDITSGRECEK